MRVVLQGHYRRSPQTRVALRVARHLAELGCEVLFRTTGRPPGGVVDPAADRRVRPAARVPAADAVVWYDPPPPAAVRAARAAGCRTVLYAPADSAGGAAGAAARLADRVVVPARAAAALAAAAWRLARPPVVAPYDPGLPPVWRAAPRPGGAVRVAVAADARRPGQTCPGLPAVVAAVLQHPAAAAAVYYHRRALSGPAYAALRRLARAHPGRLRLEPAAGLAPEQWAVRLGAADLCVCPNLYDGAALAGAAAVALGVPVVAYAVAPYTDLGAGRLVPAAPAPPLAAGPRAGPNPAGFAAAVAALVAAPAAAAALAAPAAAAAGIRRAAFAAGWAEAVWG